MGSGGLEGLKIELKMLVGDLGARRVEGARWGFSGEGRSGAVYETGRGLRVEVLLRCRGGAGGFSRKDVLRATAALGFRRSLV